MPFSEIEVASLGDGQDHVIVAVFQGGLQQVIGIPRHPSRDAPGSGSVANQEPIDDLAAEELEAVHREQELQSGVSHLLLCRHCSFKKVQALIESSMGDHWNLKFLALNCPLLSLSDIYVELCVHY